MNKIVKDWFTGPDGVSFDVARALWALGVIVFLGCAMYSLYVGQHWDAMSFGTGFGAVMAGGGIAIGMKANSEPKG